MKTIRWGILGCGDVTEVKSGPALARADNSSLVAVMRRDAALAEDYAQRHGVPRWYKSSRALIEDDEVDAVYIATPPSSHCELAIACAEAGKPALVEKPMALNATQCARMLHAFDTRGVPLFVAFYRRRLPRFMKVEALLKEGAIGEPRFAVIEQFRPLTDPGADDAAMPWRVRPQIAGGGLFVDLAPHALDYLDYLLGGIREVSGAASNMAGRYPAEDTVSARFVFGKGVQAVGMWSYAAGIDRDSLRIIGDAGEIELQCFVPTPIVLRNAQAERRFAVDDPPHVHQPLVQSIVDELNGLGSCPSTGRSGARTTTVIDSILAEYRMQHLPR
ncbi:MAG: Gfo/Idh/MocA family protein [Gammaproteobacteria bacterium]